MTSYRVKVTIAHAGGRMEHAGNALTFDSLQAADSYGRDLIGRWTLPDGYIIEDFSDVSGWMICATRSRFNALTDAIHADPRSRYDIDGAR